ncbi:MAG: cation transporter [Nitrospirae bacterium]|nr:cation transporter [Nitrospirota bacterium]
MATISLNLSKKNSHLYNLAYALALITIFYNILEGIVSVFFGMEDGTLALFGFGIDSFVEVISGIGIWHMIKRVKRNGNETLDRFEKDALKVTGTAFYILFAGLIASSMVNLYNRHKPETTFWGIIISVLSILSMWFLIHYKLKVGRQLNSQAILADANCTKACMYLSAVLFFSSIGYEITDIGWLDSAGAIFIAVLSFREGQEAFEKAKSNSISCTCNSCK